MARGMSRLGLMPVVEMAVRRGRGWGCSSLLGMGFWEKSEERLVRMVEMLVWQTRGSSRMGFRGLGRSLGVPPGIVFFFQLIGKGTSGLCWGGGTKELER